MVLCSSVINPGIQVQSKISNSSQYHLKMNLKENETYLYARTLI